MRIMKVVSGTLRNPTRHKVGRCTVCGHISLFLCLDPKTVRNNMYCLRCISASRNRHLAKVLLDDLSGGDLKSLTALSRQGQLKVLNANRNDSLSRAFRNNPLYQSSVLDPSKDLGHKFSQNESCQNLEELTFEDESFDLVITEDVFEHIHNPLQAFREIHRVLNEGGSHFFTIPFNFERHTVIRMEMIDGEAVHHLPPHYHGDKIRGKVLVVTDFGYDLFENLAKIGFSTKVTFSSYSDQKNGILDSFVFHSKKVRRDAAP